MKVIDLFLNDKKRFDIKGLSLIIDDYIDEWEIAIKNNRKSKTDLPKEYKKRIILSLLFDIYKEVYEQEKEPKYIMDARPSVYYDRDCRLDEIDIYLIDIEECENANIKDIVLEEDEQKYYRYGLWGIDPVDVFSSIINERTVEILGKERFIQYLIWEITFDGYTLNGIRNSYDNLKEELEDIDLDNCIPFEDVLNDLGAELPTEGDMQKIKEEMEKSQEETIKAQKEFMRKLKEKFNL